MFDYNELPDLESELGPIIEKEQICPGVYLLTARYDEEPLARDYYAVTDEAILPHKAKSYGRKLSGLRLFSLTDGSEEYKIIKYEIAKYRTKNHLPLDEPLHATAYFAAQSFQPISARFRFHSKRQEAVPPVTGLWIMESIGLRQTSARKFWRSAIQYGQLNCPILQHLWENRQSMTRSAI